MAGAEGLRGDLVLFAVGVLLLTLGLLALAAGLLRHASRAIVLSFGSFCTLYGLRLAASTRPARFLVDASPSFWQGLLADIT